MFKEISFCAFLEYYSIMIHSKFHSILPKNGTDTRLLAKKMHNGENAFEVLAFLYKQCKHHTQNAFSVYKWIYFGNMSYMYGQFDHFSTWKCQQLKIH